MSTHWQSLDPELGLWRSSYAFGSQRINSLAVRLGEGRIAVFGPGTKVSEESWAELDEHGEVVAIVSPGPFHHMGFPEWKARYPGVRSFAGEKGCARITKQHKGVELGLETLEALGALLPDHVVAKDVAGMRMPDLHLVVRDGSGGATWFSNELIQNESEPPDNALVRMGFAVTGTRTGLTVNNFTRLFFGGSKGPIGDFYKAELAEHGASRLVPSHGEILEGEQTAERLGEVFSRDLG